MKLQNGWAVVDVETSGPDSTTGRVLSLAALAINNDGTRGPAMTSLIDAGVDPGPTHIHGLTAAMLTGQPTFAELAPALADLLAGRIFVAHNAGFDWAFLAAEAARAGVTLPVGQVLCTVELARALQLGLDNHKLATLASHYAIPQAKPHDAGDDATVLARIFDHLLDRAHALTVPLPIRPPATLPTPTFTPAA